VLRRSPEPKQYTSAAYAVLAEENQVTLSVGRTGQCWDNALAESFFSSLKGELTDTSAWPTRAGARRAVVEYIAWYNGTRLHSSLGYRSPAQFENDHRENLSQVA
jgi:putative transposase